MDFFSKEFIKGYFKRNKKLFLISLILFVIAFLAGIIVSFATTGNNHGLISNALFSGKSSISLENLMVDTLELFFHNLYIDIITLISGLLFSIVSLGLFCVNAFMIGMPFGQDFLFAFFSIVPHSIFEYTASLFALVGAFLFTIVEIDIIKSFSYKNISIGDVIAEDMIKLKDILLSAIFMIILLLVSAIIEGNITPRIVFWFFG